MDFLQQLEENSKQSGQRKLFSDGAGHAITFAESYELSGKVYAYLSAQGIGPEDFVLINLPRGAYPLVAMCGVLRAGAAFVIVDENMPIDRVEYIRSDCGCKLVIDQNCWADIVNMNALQGFEPRDEHSAAFAVYTSGTTGAPKGVLHEYGNIARMIASSPMPKDSTVATFALISPLNFILSLLAAFVLINQCTTLIFIVPFSVVKDPMRFHAFLLENQITFSFLSPLFVRKMAPLLKSMTFCVVGAEPANNLYFPDFPVINGYSMSEVGFAITSFLIDQPYANTPVGNPVFECPIRLLDDSGNEVPEGEKGEITVANPFVRGYMNLPEKTAKVFRDGWYYTGDLGKWDEQHRLVVCGRLDDMEKVNGNRIEPGEIEIVAAKVLNLNFAAARVFHGKERPIICLYFLDDVEINPDEARLKLAEKLPHYMLPQFFIHINEIPLTAAGKFNRRGLPAPVLDEDRAAYVVPANKEQTALCSAFAKVFSITNVGIKDDFVQLGGDSVDAMEVVVASELHGLSVSDVLTGRTPEGIAQLYREHEPDIDIDMLNEQALKGSYALTANQAYTVDWQLKEPDSTMRNNYSLMKFDPRIINMDRMAAALITAAKNHPALLTEIYRTDTKQLLQRFSSDILSVIQVEHVTEAEFAQIKDTLVQPFTMIQTPLFRARVFETEVAGYVFVDIHHTVFDGSSYSILLNDVLAAYQGKELSKDYYPYVLSIQGPELIETDKAYFEQTYGGIDWCHHLQLSGQAHESAISISRTNLPISEQQLIQLEKFKGISKNGFFAIATALSVAQCEHTPNAMLFWTFNGRTNALELQTVGNLRSSLPIAFQLTKDTTFEDLCESVRKQINAGMAHGHYPYLEQNPTLLDEGVIRVLYQGELAAPAQMPGLLGVVPLGQNNLVSRSFVNLEINSISGTFELTTKYTESCYDADYMETFGSQLHQTIRILAEHISDACIPMSVMAPGIQM